MKTHTVVFTLFFFSRMIAQNTSPDLMAMLDSVEKKDNKKEYVTATFKNSHLINQQTTEVVGKNSLDFRIQHRFGDVQTGAYNAWGIDGPANIRLGLDYSYDGRLMIGIGRSSDQKMVDGYLKYKILRQTTKGGSMPITLVFVTTMFYTNQIVPSTNGFDAYPYLSDRFSYFNELIIGRKFSEKFSFQIAPTYLHYNIVQNITDKNDVWAISFATRYKLGKRFSLMAEGSFTLNKYSATQYYNESGIGWEIETGGHVFQMFFTNSSGIVENQYISQTTSTWANWGFKLGFNISRVFTL